MNVMHRDQLSEDKQRLQGKKLHAETVNITLQQVHKDWLKQRTI